MGRKGRFFESSSFKTLQKRWYSLLKKTGFEDQERLIKNGPVLSQYNNRLTAACISDVVRFARIEYYILICNGLAQEEFENPRDKIIMTMISEGKKIAEIVIELEENGFNCHRQTVRFTIRKFEKKWKIRDWPKNKLTSNLLTA